MLSSTRNQRCSVGRANGCSPSLPLAVYNYLECMNGRQGSGEVSIVNGRPVRGPFGRMFHIGFLPTLMSQA
jgi:hypothetical protein